MATGSGQSAAANPFFDHLTFAAAESKQNIISKTLFALIKSAVSAIIDHRADHARRTSHDYSRIRRNVP